MSYRLAYFVSHPIQYQAPLLRAIASQLDIKLQVFFYSDFSLRAYEDPGFDRVVQWDVPLLEGYNSQFLNCWGSKRWKSFLEQPIATDVKKQLKSGQFDAIWVHGWKDACSVQAILAANELDIPVLLREENNGLRQPKSSAKKLLRQAILSWIFNRISGFLYIGTLNYRFYRNWGINENRLFPMPYTVDNEFFQKQALLARSNREQLRRSLNLETGRPIVLYAAKLTEVKRPQDLLAAYRLLSPDGATEPEPYLLFVGDGGMRSYLESEAKATGWQSIRFLGFRNQSELPAFYDLCDVFVLPSSFEPWGLAINEVMNAAKPVIASDRVGAAVDLIKEGENGYIYPVSSVETLAKCLKNTLREPEKAIEMGKISLSRIQQWSFVEDYTGLFNALKTVVG
jgi:glycosyltransferase involved in cell wall biosynthesis